MKEGILKPVILTAIFFVLAVFKFVRAGAELWSVRFAILCGVLLLSGIIVAGWPLLARSSWSWNRAFITYVVIVIGLAWLPGILLNLSR